MVLKQEPALAGLTTVDIAELQTRCQELVDEAVSGRDPLVITRDGQPLAQLWSYLVTPIINYVQDEQGEWHRHEHDLPDSHWERTVPLSDLAAMFDVLAEDIQANCANALITHDGERIAELTPYRPSPRSPSPAMMEILADYKEPWEEAQGAEAARQDDQP